jgi:hypothetical protein
VKIAKAGRHDVDDLHAVLGASRSTWRVGAMEILPVDVAPPPLQSSLTFEDIGALVFCHGLWGSMVSRVSSEAVP